MFTPLPPPLPSRPSQVACQGDLAVVKRSKFWGQGEEVLLDLPEGAAGSAGSAGAAAAADVMPLGQLEFVLDRRRQQRRQQQQ